jgi:hypothetical protein
MHADFGWRPRVVGDLKVELRFEPSDFAGFLEGERDNDLARYLSAAVTTRLLFSLEASLGSGWLKHKIEGHQHVRAIAGIPGSAGFTLKQVLCNGGLMATDFRVQIDLEKGQSEALEDVLAGPGVSFSNSFSRYYAEGQKPTLAFKPMSKWDRHGLRCNLLHFDREIFPFKEELIEQCECPASYLRPVWVSEVGRVPNWICICCGKRYLCRCSEGLIEHFVARPNYSNTAYEALASIASYRDACCHLCRGVPCEVQLRSPMYGGTIYQYYHPYIEQEQVLHGIDAREAENRVRDRMGIPRIGEGWVSEMLLINTVRSLFPDLHVEHQASPSWLGQQRFDGYIADRGVAIEYNGAQHYYPVERFGGQAGLRRTQERDARKLELAARHGVEVVVVRHDENLSEKALRERIEAALNRQAERREGRP